jgi:hypothetical protein
MSDVAPESFDPRQRRLCPDGACVGVVGPDARCKVCGTLDEGAVGLPPEALAGGCASEIDEEEREAVRQRAAEAAEAADFNPARKLCPDGACVGVIGDDGRCKACGASADA